MSKLWCFVGVHDMKIYNHGPYVRTWTDCDDRKEGHWYHLRCDRCGAMKYKILI